MPETAKLARPETDWTGAGGFFAEQFGVERTDPIYGLPQKHQEERVWDAMLDICSPVSSVVKKRSSAVASAGFTVVDGTGTRAEFYGSFARSMMTMEGWTQFVLDLLLVDVWGWRFLEGRPRTEPVAVLKGFRKVWLPQRMDGYEAWHGEFTQDRNFILRPTASADGQEHRYETNGAGGFHVDQVRWMLPSFNKSSSPYGESAIRRAWMLAQIYQNMLTHMAKRAPWSLGLLKFNWRDPKKPKTERVRETKAVLEDATNAGAIDQDDSVRIEVDSNASFPAGFADIFRILDAAVYEALTGSSMAQTVGDSGNRATSVIHEHSTNDDALTLGRKVADSLKHDWLIHWLNFNGFFPTPDELPVFKSRLEPKAAESFITLASTMIPSSIDWAAEAARNHLAVLDEENVPFEKPAPVALPAPPDEPEDEEEDEPDEDADDS